MLRACRRKTAPGERHANAAHKNLDKRRYGPSQPVQPDFRRQAGKSANGNADDPTWYAAQAAALQAELDQREADLQEQQTAIAQAANRITTPGVSLTEKDAGVTPAAGLAILQALVQETQTKLDDLADVARQHSILPGALRG